MQPKLHLIMPMAGGGTRFLHNGFEQPKPMLMLHGRPFFYYATESIRRFAPVGRITFVVLREHVERFAIDKAILALYPEAELVVLPEVLNGAVLTCLRGVETVEDGAPILFNDCDHLFRCDAFGAFCRAGRFESPDGALMTFRSNDNRYSYVETDAAGRVRRTVEKQAVSDQAICGAYYFKDRQTFRSAAETYLHHCAYSEYYVSGVYNEMAAAGETIRIFPVEYHVPFGTPEEYAEAENCGRFGDFQ